MRGDRMQPSEVLDFWFAEASKAQWWSPSPEFDRTIRDESLSLGVGDRLLLCTRTLFSIANDKGKEVGERNVYRLFGKESAKNSEAFIPLVMHRLEGFKGDGEAEDIALLTLKRIA